MTESTVRIGLIYPSILGTYGDSGNALVLLERIRRRGMSATIVEIDNSDPIPADLDIYTLGGGEDSAQAIAAAHMRKNPGLVSAASKGAPILAICASLQVLGESYTDATGKRIEGLGLLDLTTTPMGKRAIGEVLEHPLIDGLTQPLTGFENHGGGTKLGPDAKPLGRVVRGIGNSAEAIRVDNEDVRYEGAVQGSIIGTYLHGPALARNPELADYLIAKATGQNLDPLVVPGVERLREERLQFVSR